MSDIFDINPNIDLKKIETISDLEEKEFNGSPLNEMEMEALRLFRSLRLKKLRKKTRIESQFHKKFEYFRAISNLMDYKEFLKRQGANI